MKISYLLVMLLGCAFSVQAQSIKVTGKVTSAEDQAGLPGVNVVVKGTTNGTVSDVDGNYTLNIPGRESVLQYSSVGYVQQEVLVGDQTVINVTMEPDVTSL